MSKPFAVVGAGFSGAVVARELALHTDRKIIVWDERAHVAGNCHTERDETTGVMLHRYGPHIFHTSREEVWNYVNRFATFRPFVNRVKAVIPRGVFGLPINLHTINQFFGRQMNPVEAKEFIRNLGDASILEPANFEEQALRFLGRELYEAFFYGYTRKQWGCEPREIPAAVLSRLPVRFNYNDNYYDSLYQGIPEEGYTVLVKRILDHPRIELRLGERVEAFGNDEFEHLFYTGPLDAFFGHRLGRLSYRTVTFDRVDAEGDYQGNPVLNYPSLEVAHTRIHEHKHFAPWENHQRTVCFVEYSKQTEPGDVPYYPVRRPLDKVLLANYLTLAQETHRVSFLGRLATYRYLDMHKVIGEALDFASAFLSDWENAEKRPKFPA